MGPFGPRAAAMAEFSISDTAFTGFRIVRERPTAVLIWAIIQLIASLAATSLFVGMAGPTLMQLRTLGPQLQLNPQQGLAIFRHLAPVYGLILAFELVFNALLFAAMNRAVFRPDDEAFGYFRFGADEFRQLGLLLLAFCLWLVTYLILLLAGVAVTAL